jgi:hypothetical protein
MRLSLVALHLASPIDRFSGGPIAGEGISRMDTGGTDLFCGRNATQDLHFQTDTRIARACRRPYEVELGVKQSR